MFSLEQYPREGDNHPETPNQHPTLVTTFIDIQDRLLRFIEKDVPEPDSLDLLQNIYLSICNVKMRCSEIEAIEAYLFTTATNEKRRYWRDDKKQRDTEDTYTEITQKSCGAWLDSSSIGEQPSDFKKWEYHPVEQLLEAFHSGIITKDQYSVLALCFERVSIKEIATRLGMKPNTVSAIKKRGLAALNKKFGPFAA